MFKTLLCSVLVVGFATFGFNWGLYAEDAYVEINLSSLDKSQPIAISIDRKLAQKFQFLPGQELIIQTYVCSSDGQRHFIKDIYGNDQWKITLDQQSRGSFTFLPAETSYTGRLTVSANQKVIYDPGLFDSGDLTTLEFVEEYQFEDGAGIKVHYTSQILEASGARGEFPRQVLEASREAYEKIVQESGFDREGYSFARADTSYAYDEDKVIDIYIGSNDCRDEFRFHSLDYRDFKNAPFYEMRYEERYRYSAVLAIPADYQACLKEASRQFGYSDNIDMSSHLKGALMHEMLHVITFYYNKNLLSWYELNPLNKCYEGGDWYVEGLARYFETLIGFEDNFYSAGFYQRINDRKVRYMKGGVNWFMRRPDQKFSELEYDFAIFWKYLYQKFGMEAIEELSCGLRFAEKAGGEGGGNISRIIEQATGAKFSEVIRDFAKFVWTAAEKDGNIEPVASYNLIFNGRPLNKRENVNGWATDYYHIAMRPSLVFNINKISSSGDLSTQVGLVTEEGFIIVGNSGINGRFDLEQIIRENHIDVAKIKEIVIMVSNVSSAMVKYELLLDVNI